MSQRTSRSASFSLVEVVLALGVISIAIVAILGLFPVALSTGHSAQDLTRAPHIAQAVLSRLVSQAPTQFNNVQLQLGDPGNTTLSIDLTASSSPTAPTFYADHNGQLAPSPDDAAYAITIFTNNSPPGFPPAPPAYANQVIVRVAAPAIAAPANQTYRDYVRIISKY
jgi:uncharacterized protein (TIGR02598 family)